MTAVAYKNHNIELNDLYKLLLNRENRVILYNSHAGYGNSAFIQRMLFMLHTTPTFQLFHAELTTHSQNAIHEVVKNIVCKKEALYQKLQLFSDEQNGSKDISIYLPALIKDFTQSETLMTLFKPQEAIPIYAGFYPDRLKQNFFQLISLITQEKRVLFFIDNIQYMDQESLYELQGLLQYPNITLILFKSGDGEIFNKFQDEIEFKYSEVKRNFPEPDIKYVQELATLYKKSLSEPEAAAILTNNNRDVRKILHDIRKPDALKINSIFVDQILKIVSLYDDYISKDELLKICSFTPYSGIITEDEISNCIESIENIGLFQKITDFETRKKYYKTVSTFNISLDVADEVVISKTYSDYYNTCIDLDYKHLCHAWNVNSLLDYTIRKDNITKKILLVALKMGYRVPSEVINYAKQKSDISIKILSATFLFCNANYSQAKSLLEDILIVNNHRSLNVMYAISLNRCREHESAEKELLSLIDSSIDIDELAILVSFLISNCVHSRKISDAKAHYNFFSKQLKTSKKYPYFLRNAATVFDASNAYAMRKEALSYFKKTEDFFGFYSTIINMTNYFLRHETIEYAICSIQEAFDKMQQFNASQIHLAANNLGVCYLYANDAANTLKYLTLCYEKAQTIMPKGYAAINLSSFFLQRNNLEKADSYLYAVKKEISASTLPRLKAHFYLQCLIVEYAKGNNPEANKAAINVAKYCSSTESSQIYQVAVLINDKMKKDIPYSVEMFSSIFVPCILEYWTINSIDVLADDFLPK